MIKSKSFVYNTVVHCKVKGAELFERKNVSQNKYRVKKKNKNKTNINEYTIFQETG